MSQGKLIPKCQWPQRSAAMLCKHDYTSAGLLWHRRMMEEAVLLFCPLHCEICSLKYGQGSRKKIFHFTTGHLRHKLGKHQAVRAVKAVHAHNRHDAMHQYVMTNLSLRDTIRRRQEQPVIGWRESWLTAKERQSCIKDQLCQEDGDTALSSPQSPHSMLFISRSE